VTVYFITELDGSDEWPQVKIGRSKDVRRRMENLQTGNPRELALMGEIKTRSAEADREAELALHRRFSKHRRQGEWFDLRPEDVIEGLKTFSPIAYIAVGENPFEIIGYDKDAVPEYASAWAWGDVDIWDFCPACGWACGWTYSENWGGLYCIECGASEHDYSREEGPPERDR